MSDLSSENTSQDLPETLPNDYLRQVVDQLPQAQYITRLRDERLGPYTPDWIPIYIYKAMRRDSNIKVGLVLLKSIISAVDRYRLRGSTPRVRGFIRRALWPHLPELLKRILNALDFGFQAFELVYDVQSISFEVESESQKKISTKSEATLIRKFVDLDPEYVEPLVEEGTNKFAGIKYKNERTLPPTKVLYSIFDGEFGNLYGNSILDPAYPHWWNSNVGNLFWGRWMERLAAGVYVGTAPHRAQRDEKGNKQFPVKVMTALLMALRSAGVITIPYDPDPVTKENRYKVELVETSHSGEAFQNFLDYHQNLKLRAILFPEKILGSIVSQSGSFAAHESFMDLYFQWVNWIIDTVVLSPINEQVIYRLTKYNFSSAQPPRLEVTPLDKTTKRLFMDILKATLDHPVWFQDNSKKIASGNVDLRELARMVGLPLRDPEDIPVIPSNEQPNTRNSKRDTIQTTPDEQISGPRNPKGVRE